MSPDNPQICNAADRDEAEKFLNEIGAGGGVSHHYGPGAADPSDGDNKMYMFKMNNGAHVNAALVSSTIRNNGPRAAEMLKLDINGATEAGISGTVDDEMPDYRQKKI